MISHDLYVLQCPKCNETVRIPTREVREGLACCPNCSALLNIQWDAERAKEAPNGAR